MEELNLIKNDTAYRSLTPKYILGRWPKASLVHFHHSLKVEKILPRAKDKKTSSFVFIEAESLVDPPTVFA